MRSVPSLLLGLLVAGCSAAQDNSFEERLLARIDAEALAANGSAEAHFDAPSDKRYFFQVYLNPDAVPDSVRSSYQSVTDHLDRIERDLLGARFEVVGDQSSYHEAVELTSDGLSIQWGYTSDPIYGFWSNWPGTELPAGDYVFRLALPDAAVPAVDSVTVERVKYETGP